MMEKRGRDGNPVSCCREEKALLGTEPWADGAAPGAEIHAPDGLRALPVWVPERPPSSPAGIRRDGFLPSPGCHCVPTFDQESAFLECSISHMLC